MKLIRAKLEPPIGNGSAPPIYQYVPQELRDDISHILETEGIVNESAESRIFRRNGINATDPCS